MFLQHCWSRRARRPSETLVPEAWGSAVAPVMGAGATAFTRGKAQRMGSEPFQFTDAPFHLRAEGQKERVRAAGPTREPPPRAASLT